ncbi:MAG: BspA family leucine-rich repeat surface protein [Candidatus Magasanikbacteria bacterium]|nr:BspA family leucine-rich repeat surface protein [Candidatus Magasanikbacteria bacterium]
MKLKSLFLNLFFALAVLGISFFIAPSPTYAAGEFITTWKTDNPGTSTDHQITIPIDGTYTYNYSVDWGDTNTDSGITGSITHTYVAAGTHQIKITGTFPVIKFAGAGDAQKILSVDQWGTNVWGSMFYSFFGCSNLHILATDAPDLSAAGDMTYMLRGTAITTEDLSSWDVSHISAMIGLFQDTSFNGNITTWNTGTVTDMTGLFYNDSSFNQDIGGWNVGAVTNMASMFYTASSFNQNLSLWNVSNVTNMSDMFRNAGGFNSALAWGNKTVHVTNMSGMFLAAYTFNQGISGWNTSAVTNMSDMFAYAYDFNQNIGLWNVGAVTDMGTMLYQATSFNYSLSSWNVSNVTTMDNIFGSDTLSSTNYDAILTSWSAQAVQPGILFGAGSSKYCAAGAARASLIANHSWTISDGGTTCHTVTYSAGVGGSISGLTTQYVENGADGSSVIVTARAGYKFLSWTDNSTQNPRTEMNITTDKSVTALYSAFSGNVVSYVGCGDANALNYDHFAINISSMCIYPKFAPTVPQQIFLPSVPEVIAISKLEIIKPVFDFSKISKVTKDLKFGMSSSDVKTLQDFLIAQNQGPSAAQLKKHGTTNYFGKLTQATLAEWQKANGIAPAQGNFGPLTRKFIKNQVFPALH